MATEDVVDEKPRGKVGAWLRNLDNYWFGHHSPTSLGLFRIVMSSLVFVNLVMILTDFDAWFTERGFVPQAVAKHYQGDIPLAGNFFGLPFHFSLPIIGDTVPRLDIFLGISDQLALCLYLAVMVATLLCAFGLWTRATSIIMAVGVVSLHHRNAVVLHGGDSVLRLGALYIALAPSGAACSLDRIIRLWKGKLAPGPVRTSVWVQRLLSYNTALIYFTTFWHKYGFGSHWRDMTATWYPARLHEFERFPVPSFLNQLPFVYFSTFFTLAVELAMGTLVFYRPLRKWVLLSAIGLHAYIDYSMNIPLFSWLMVALYFSFYDGEEIDSWARRLGQRMARFQAIVRLPVNMRFRPAPGAAIEAMDPLGLVAYDPGKSPAWEATAGDKPIDPFRGSLRRSIGAWPVAIVPKLWRRLLTRSLETAPERASQQPEEQRAKIRR